ncbi:iron-containing redox enzyme family protein [Dactylosporangium sp. CA-139114]|uniref:iron-containing redox enzyme family protein n=1 Tax=Dactylosporangium sp. CA-139114 TaxID=3239931 RepID=UPI003D991CD3
MTLEGRSLYTPWHVGAADALVDANARDWDYDSRFRRVEFPDLHPAVIEADALVDRCGVEHHRFFTIAGRSRDALALWVEQEVFVTGVFAQLLSLTASTIVNVHLRAMFNVVVHGEHGPTTRDEAKFAHPTLLHNLRESMGIVEDDMRLAPPTQRFLEAIARSMTSTLSALGSLGVGNERMLVPEYSAVEKAFDQAWPDAGHRAFLRANIEEDTEHSAIISRIASTMISMQPETASQYSSGAKSGVDARMRYYDELTSLYESRTAH